MKSILTVLLLTMVSLFGQTTQKFKGIQLDGAPTNGNLNGTIYYDATAGTQSLGAIQSRVGTQWVNSTPYSPFWEDSFSGTDTTLLDARLGERGNLQKVIGGGGSNTMVIDNDGNTSFARSTTSSTALYLASPTPQTSNYSVTLGIKYLTSNNAFMAVAGRMDYATQNVGAGPAGSSGYLAGYSTTDGAWQLYSISAGSVSAVLGSYTQALVAGTTYDCRLEMIGTTIKVYVNGTLRITITNSAHAGPGRVGVWVANASTRTTGLMADYARADDGELAPAMVNNLALVFQGDSLLGGYPNSYARTIPQRIAALLRTPYVWNFSADAKTQATVEGENATTITPAYAAANLTGRPVAWNDAAANDLNASTSAATILTSQQVWNRAAQALGYVTVQTTVTKNALLTGAKETQRGLLNADIVAGNSYADIVIDPASNPAFNNTSNTAIFSDGTHFTELGKQIYAYDCAQQFLAKNAYRQAFFFGNVGVDMATPSVPRAPFSIGPGIGKRLGVYEDGVNFSGFVINSNQTAYAFGGNGVARFSILASDGGTEFFTIKEATGRVGVGTVAPDETLDLNIGTTGGLQLSYNDADGSATNKVKFGVTSGGDATIVPSGGDTTITGRHNSNVTTPATLGAGAVTFAVTSNVVVITGDGGGNTVGTITGGTAGMILTLTFVDSLVTITDTAAATADTVNLSAAFTSSSFDTLTLLYVNGKWLETARSVN